MTTYRLGSTSMVYTPGLIKWAIAGARADCAIMVRIVAEGWNIPRPAAKALVTGKAPFTVEGETVVFSA